MKKIIIISILLIFSVFISVLYILSRFEKYSGLIINKENDIIIVQLQSSTLYKKIDDNINEEIECKYYLISIKDVLIKNHKGYKVDDSELRVGDIINIYKIKEKIEKDILYDIKPLYNVKIIKILEKN